MRKQIPRVLAFLLATGPVVAQTVRINELCAYSESLQSYGLPPGTSWETSGFDDADWGSTHMPIGMDSGSDYKLPLNLYSEIYFKAYSVYARSNLQVEASLAESSEPVSLAVDYDDAFVLFINGKEVARGNIGNPGSRVFYSTAADSTHRASNDQGDGVDHTEIFALGPAHSVFSAGLNTIAVQVHNDQITSSDLFIEVDLQIGDVLVTDTDAEWKYFIGRSEPDGANPYPDVESDWIELHNPGQDTLNLEGWSLTDDPDEPRKWVFPALEIASNGYLLILASGGDISRSIPWEQASFKLDSSGEYLGLRNAEGSIISELSPGFPEQVRGTSYGWDNASQSYQILASQSPGWVNAEAGLSGWVEDTRFSVDRGFYDEPFMVEISSETEGASIRYTTDGSTPSALDGELYSGPVEISTTTVLRAVAFKEGMVPTNVDTQSYIFIDDVIGQDNSPEGYPATWKSNSGKADLPADYEMDLEVTGNPRYSGQMRAALLSLPTISLVTDIGNLFDRSTGLYQNPEGHGAAWERPVSIEVIYPNGRKSFQADCGVRIQGGHTRNPERMPKHSFRLAFRNEYGSPELGHSLFDEPDASKKIDTVILRGGGNQSWLHHNGFRGDNRGRAQYIRDQFAKNMQGRMGWTYLHNNYAFLYINGLFWGLYNPTERASDNFGEVYLGGEKSEYDALNSSEVIDGNFSRWSSLTSSITKDLRVALNYRRVEAMLDLEQFTDYMLLNHWGGNEDWDHHNWYALGNRVDGRFGLYTWDSEFFFEAGDSNTVRKNTLNNPGGFFHALLKNPEYRMLVSDRIYKHFHNGGMLTTETALEEWNELTARVYPALIAESARWGDYRRDVHRMTGPYLLYTRDDQWVKERQRLLEDVIPVRNALTLQQYAELGLNLIPNAPVPDFSKDGGSLSDRDPLELSTPDVRGAVIYYTVDGSDPRLSGGEVAPEAMIYSEPIHITGRTTVRARVNNWSGWSPLREGHFHPEGDPADLVISEILYAPLPDDDTIGGDLEFIEILNAGNAPIPLDGLQFTDGIDFIFPDGQVLQPDKRLLVVSDQDAFVSRHPDAPVAGQFAGSLSNQGELITLEHASLGLIQQVVYSSGYPWPAEAAHAGHSLVPRSLSRKPQPTHSTAWRASFLPGGSPGTADTGQPAWIQHPVYGWVYSETGQTGPGNWLWGPTGFFYVGQDFDSGTWIWWIK